jgi:hypothetical protein
MLSDIRKRGFEEGFKIAKQAKDDGKSLKTILKFEANDKQIAKKFMEEFKVGKDKAFRFGVIYSFGYSSGVLNAVYG